MQKNEKFLGKVVGWGVHPSVNLQFSGNISFFKTTDDRADVKAGLQAGVLGFDKNPGWLCRIVRRLKQEQGRAKLMAFRGDTR